MDPVRDWDGVSAQWGESIPRLCLVILVERCSEDSGQTSFLIFSKAGQMERKQSYDSPTILQIGHVSVSSLLNLWATWRRKGALLTLSRDSATSSDLDRPNALASNFPFMHLAWKQFW